MLESCPEHAALDPGHVEQVGDECGEPVGLDVDAFQGFPRVIGILLDVLAEQVGHRGLDGGQRAAQVVGDGRQQRPADLVALPINLGLGGLAGQPVALQHERELVAERLQHPAFPRA
jgi:hypothetical protein